MNERDNPFLVYTTHRPHRIAFLIDVKNRQAMDQIDKVIAYASRKWGGKFFQIIPVENKRVSKSWVSYLSEYDPDIIKTFTELDRATIRVLAENCHPYVFDRDDPARPIHLHDDPVDVLPTQQNTAMLTGPFSEPHILTMELGNQNSRTPNNIKRFVRFNFGQQDTTYVTQNLIAKYKVKNEKVYSKKSLAKAMERLAEWTGYIHPIDYSRLPGVYYETKRSYDKNEVILFIGDSPYDVIHYWNSALLSPQWLSKREIHAWIPEHFITDEKLLVSVKKWMEKFADTGNGNNGGYKKLTIASHSINKNKLDKYARWIAEGIYTFVTAEKIKEPTIPKYSPHIGIANYMNSYSVSGDLFNVNLPPIDQQQGGMGGQKWMVDIQIQRHDNDGRVMPAKELWLQYPRNNNLSDITFDKRVSRVNRLGLPTIPLSRESDSLLVTVKIPEEDRVLGNILQREPDAIHYNGDLRKDIRKAPFDYYRYSQSGRLLRGFTHLFGGLMEAAHFFEASYWRRVIMTLAGENPSGDSTTYKDLKNRVKKNLPKASNPPSERDIDFWANTVRTYAQKLKFDTSYKSFDFFKEELEEEIKQFKAKNGGKGKDYDEGAEERLRDNLSWLINSNVLHSGVMNNCRHCGLKSWYATDDIKTFNECSGCGYEFSIRAEEKWWYKLNSLSGSNRAIYSQIPVIIALGELHDQSKYSFYYVPSIEVYPQNSSKVLTDFDIFAFVDGKLVIGEVKNTQDLFKDNDFEKLYIASSKLKPDKVILSSIDIKPNKVNEQRIKDLESRLKPLGIAVEWLELNPMIFERYPYYI